ncbi:sodium:proton antiporter [Zobellella denitrificans]|jgi:multisubunit Na+/H+ antiporter MnhB subunit|uniref:MnhB domain-containing protein n=1 Tax=Zobellella denitrificans TaxID=347534 RepID=UPI000B8BDE9E|nr:MnhB domain-containing protein [Zobellella denitrificans]OXS14375.1 sodium:proton antiporter [Zobellella denitrificans]
MKVALVLLSSLALTGALGYTAWQVLAREAEVDLRLRVAERLPDSGVDHAITAVLLNFRSYDTLLEIGVLMVAGLAGLSMRAVAPMEARELRTQDPLLQALMRWFVPLLLVLAAYLLWAGSDRPGGAFQAGSVLGATGVLLRLGGVPLPFLRPGPMLRLGLVIGFAVFLLVAVMGAVRGDAFLAYPPAWAGGLILLIEAMLTLSIAMVLVGLFAVAPAQLSAADREDAP